MTLQELRDSARAKADEQSTDFISNAELDRYLNQGYRFVYSKIAQRFEDYFITRATAFNTVAGTDTYNLPTGMLKLVAVEFRQAGSTQEAEWRPVGRVNYSEPRQDYYYPPRPGYEFAPFGYYVEGGKLVIRPVPSSSFQVRVRHVPAITALSAASDVPLVGEEYHDLISEFAAIQMLRKSGEGIFNEAMQIFNMELSNLLETVESRDIANDRMIITQFEDY